MGEVAVVHPHDILKNHCNRNNLIQSPMKSRKPPKNSRNSSKSPPKNDSKNLITGKVKILRRGESLTDLTASEKSKTVEAPTWAGLMGPLPKQMNFFAGSAFITSSPPSSVRLPAFCKKSENNDWRHHLKP